MSKLSPRADRAWQRLVQMFGQQMLTLYPRGMPDNMAQVIDRVDNETVVRGLAALSQLNRTPTVADVAQAMSSTPAAAPSRNRMGDLTAYIMQNYRLTGYQTRTPWTWLAQGNPREKSQNFAVVGVRIPDDPDGTPGFTVDMAVLA